MSPIEAIKAFLEALDRKREIKPWLHGGAFIDVVHGADCYTELPVCGCGGFEQKNEVKDALEALRMVVARG